MIEVVRELPRSLRSGYRKHLSPIGLVQGLACGPVRGNPHTEPVSIFGSSNIRQWVRGDSGMTLAGSNISAWNDRSSGGWHYTQGTAGKRPTKLLDPTLNNLPVALLDGVDDTLTSSLLLDKVSISATTIFAVVCVPSYGAGSVLFGSNTTNGADLVVYSHASPGIGTSAAASNLFTAPPANTWFRLAVIFSNNANGVGTDVVRIGAGYITSQLVGDTDADTVGRKMSPFTVYPGNFKVWELLYVAGIPTTQQLNEYDSYVTRVTSGSVLL